MKPGAQPALSNHHPLKFEGRKGIRPIIDRSQTLGWWWSGAEHSAPIPIEEEPRGGAGLQGWQWSSGGFVPPAANLQALLLGRQGNRQRCPLHLKVAVFCLLSPEHPLSFAFGRQDPLQASPRAQNRPRLLRNRVAVGERKLQVCTGGNQLLNLVGFNGCEFGHREPSRVKYLGYEIAAGF